MKKRPGVDLSPWPSLGQCNELAHAPTRTCTHPTLGCSASVSLPSTPLFHHGLTGGRRSLDPHWSRGEAGALHAPQLGPGPATGRAKPSTPGKLQHLLPRAWAASGGNGYLLQRSRVSGCGHASDRTVGNLNGRQVTLNGQTKHIHDVCLCFCEMVLLVPSHNP